MLAILTRISSSLEELVINLFSSGDSSKFYIKRIRYFYLTDFYAFEFSLIICGFINDFMQ